MTGKATLTLMAIAATVIGLVLWLSPGSEEQPSEDGRLEALDKGFAEVKANLPYDHSWCKDLKIDEIATREESICASCRDGIEVLGICNQRPDSPTNEEVKAQFSYLESLRYEPGSDPEAEEQSRQNCLKHFPKAKFYVDEKGTHCDAR